MANHVETVQKIYDCFGRGDIARLLEHLEPDVEWEHDWGLKPPVLYSAGRGHGVVTRFFQALRDYDFIRFEPAPRARRQAGRVRAGSVHAA